MKHLKYLFIIVFLCSVFSCNNDFLDVNPESALTDENFFTSEEDFNNAVISLYSSFRDIHSSMWHSYTEYRCDNLKFNGTGFANGANNNLWGGLSTQDMWNALFRIISRANLILKNIDKTKIDYELIKQFKGEALFFRGWAYFACVRFFGGVQIIHYDSSIEDFYTIPRSSIAETYEQAEQDISEAIGLLPNKYDDANYGRITKYAAQGILSRLYLQKTGWPVNDQAGFGKAKILLKDIIDNSQYGFHTNYQEIFSMEEEKGKEMVLSVVFSTNGGQLNTGIQNWIAKIPGIGNAAIMFAPEQSLFESYETGDLRRDVSIDTVFIDNTGKLVKHLNINKYYYGYISGQGSEFDMPVLRFTDVLLMYAEALCGENKTVNSEAVAIINQVRGRAGLPPVQPSNYDAFRDALFKERRSEFFMEGGSRWFDIVRSGMAVDALKAVGRDADETWLLYPLPPAEIDKAPNVLTQNPGYL